MEGASKASTIERAQRKENTLKKIWSAFMNRIHEKLNENDENCTCSKNGRNEDQEEGATKITKRSN